MKSKALERCADNLWMGLQLKTTDLVVRCFAEQAEGQWTVVCLDFSLAAQSESLDDATALLVGQLKDYVSDALTGIDADYANELLVRRRAPLGLWLKFYKSKFLNWCSSDRNGPNFKGFSHPLPLTPVTA